MRPLIFALLLSASHAFGDSLGGANYGELFGYKLGASYFQNQDFRLDDVEGDGFVRYTVRYRGRPVAFDEVTLSLTPLSHILVSFSAIAPFKNKSEARSCAIEYVSKFRNKYPEWEGGARNNPRTFEGREDYVVLRKGDYSINVLEHKNNCVVTFGRDPQLSLRRLARKERSQMIDAKASK